MGSPFATLSSWTHLELSIRHFDLRLPFTADALEIDSLYTLLTYIYMVQKCR